MQGDLIMITTLSAMPYAQAKVHITENTVYLMSYKTVAVYIDPQGWLVVNGLYSATTRKHIGAFMREYANADYQLAKQLYTDGYMYNVHTGEVIKL